jgi:hypothetical protein
VTRSSVRWLRPGASPVRAAWWVAACSVVGLTLACLLMTASAQADTTADPVLGQTDTFRVRDWGVDQDVHLAATVQYIGDNVVIYGEKGRVLPIDFISGLGNKFDDEIYPTLTQVLGPVPDPGIDGQHRIVILLYDFGADNVFGAFERGDVDPRAPSPDSNRRDMFMLNLAPLVVDPVKAAPTSAHELAHLILFNGDYLSDPLPTRTYEGDVAPWVEEGVAMYAELACGFGPSAEEQLRSFELGSNKNLTIWTDYNKDYGASYALMAYLADRLGTGFVRELVAQPKDGIAGIEAVLEARGVFDTRFAPLFDDWAIANFLDGRSAPASQFTYSALHVAVEPRADEIPLPWVGTQTVKNYAAVYLDAPPTDPALPVRVVVDGEDRAPLHATLVSWDSAGLVSPALTDVPLSPVTAGGSGLGPPGYDRHTLVVWARGTESVDRSYVLRFSVAAAPDDLQFLDVGSDHLFYSYITALVEWGIVNGQEVPPVSALWYFKPDDAVTRQQFAKMVVQAVGLHTEPVESLDDSTFADVWPAYDAYGQPLPYPFDYVEEAAAAQIVFGSQDVHGVWLFHPGDPIKRIQLVQMIVRAASAVGHPFPPYTGSEAVFADVPPGSPLYAAAMTGFTNGILTGSVDARGVRRLLPWEPATRGQVAKMTANLVDGLESGADVHAVRVTPSG